MRAKIVRLIDKSLHKDPTCVICGEAKRKNKGLFAVKLACNYEAEVRICRTCSGEEGAMRSDNIELPFMDPYHWHIQDHLSKTFWDYVDTLNWVKDFMQAPSPQPDGDGRYVMSIPHRDFKFFRCDGKPQFKGADLPQQGPGQNVPS